MAVLTGKNWSHRPQHQTGLLLAPHTTQSGFVKEADQTAIFVYSSNLYKIYFKMLEATGYIMQIFSKSQ